MWEDVFLILLVRVHIMTNPPSPYPSAPQATGQSVFPHRCLVYLFLILSLAAPLACSAVVSLLVFFSVL